jgi:hypothetical protein
MSTPYANMVLRARSSYSAWRRGASTLPRFRPPVIRQRVPARRAQSVGLAEYLSPSIIQKLKAFATRARTAQGPSDDDWNRWHVFVLAAFAENQDIPAFHVRDWLRENDWSAERASEFMPASTCSPTIATAARLNLGSGRGCHVVTEHGACGSTNAGAVGGLNSSQSLTQRVRRRRSSPAVA